MDEATLTATKISISLGKFVWLYIKSPLLKTLNLLRRPKLIIKFKIEHFDFIGENQAIARINIPYIAITNNKHQKIKIIPSLVFFNNICYAQMYNSDILRQLDETKKLQVKPIDNTEIMYKYFKDNCFEITQGRASFLIAPEQTKIFPIMLIGCTITNLMQKKKNSRLFMSNKKIILTLNINGKNYEYGLPRTVFYEQYLNYLASYTARYKPEKY